MFAENLVGLGVLQSVSYIKPFPTHETLFAVGKSGANATFNHFSWAGLALGWGVRRFHNDIYMFSNKPEFGKSRTPYYLLWEWCPSNAEILGNPSFFNDCQR